MHINIFGLKFWARFNSLLSWGWGLAPIKIEHAAKIHLSPASRPVYCKFFVACRANKSRRSFTRLHLRPWLPSRRRRQAAAVSRCQAENNKAKIAPRTPNTRAKHESANLCERTQEEAKIKRKRLHALLTSTFAERRRWGIYFPRPARFWKSRTHRSACARQLWSASCRKLINS